MLSQWIILAEYVIKIKDRKGKKNMVKLFKAKTANELWKQAAKKLINTPTQQESRQGLTREYLHCSLHLENPQQRWITSRQPAINPAFAIAEVIWILQGSDDANFINFWNPKLPEYSGKGRKYHGAYGARLRKHFTIDQLNFAYDALRQNEASRQVVLQIWDSSCDFPIWKGKPNNEDIPCNIASMLKIRSSKLEWSQIMRSNDLYRGTPHNIIQFTSLQEIIAGWLQVQLGSFTLFADSLHFYEKDIKEVQIIDSNIPINSDSLMFSKTEFDEFFPIVFDYLDKLRSIELNRNNFIKLTHIKEIPRPWKNLLCIVAADAVRRKGWYDEMEYIVEQCNNSILLISWQNWLNRQNSKRKIK